MIASVDDFIPRGGAKKACPRGGVTDATLRGGSNQAISMGGANLPSRPLSSMESSFESSRRQLRPHHGRHLDDALQTPKATVDPIAGSVVNFPVKENSSQNWFVQRYIQDHGFANDDGDCEDEWMSGAGIDDGKNDDEGEDLGAIDYDGMKDAGGGGDHARARKSRGRVNASGWDPYLKP